MHFSYSLVVEALVDAHLGLVEPARAKIERGAQTGGRAGQPLCRFRAARDPRLPRALARKRTRSRPGTRPTRSGGRGERTARAGTVPLSRRRDRGEDHCSANWTTPKRCSPSSTGWERSSSDHGSSSWPAAAARSSPRPAATFEPPRRNSSERSSFTTDWRSRSSAPAHSHVLGNVLRRDRKKRAAREALQGALETFRRLGATLWETKTQAELARVGGRAPTTGGLTPTEQRIAELIASGLSYRETADALFISPKTVQWNLSKIYRKLDIHSRAELPARLAARPGPSPPAGSSQAEAG